MEWISVKDRLPDGEGEYLCWVASKDGIYKCPRIVRTWRNRIWEIGFNCVALEYVTHWLPIHPPEDTHD